MQLLIDESFAEKVISADDSVRLLDRVIGVRKSLAYSDIISKLKSDGAIFRCQGILECLKSRENAGEIPGLLKKMKSDSVVILGRKVGSFASAALDILGEERYEGEEEEIIELISDLKELLSSA